VAPTDERDSDPGDAPTFAGRALSPDLSVSYLKVRGTGNPLVEQVSLQRLAQAGATLTAWVQLGAELLESWATPEGEHLARVFQEHLSVSTLSPS
jgi:hypothetical protein